MKPNIRSFCILLISLTALLSPAICNGSNFDYQLRGKGANLRHEGIKSDKKAGDFSLISFVSTPFQWKKDQIPDFITIKFYTPIDRQAFISVGEIDVEHSYRMKANRSNWPFYEVNTFTWPTEDVIKPLNISPDNLSFVIFERQYGGSGTVYPAIVGSQNLPKTIISGYRLIFTSKYTCAPLKWSLYNVVDRAWTKLKSGFIKSAMAIKSHSLELNFSQIKDGWYRVELTCERKGYGLGGGKDNKQKRYYEFYHRRVMP